VARCARHRDCRRGKLRRLGRGHLARSRSSVEPLALGDPDPAGPVDGRHRPLAAGLDLAELHVLTRSHANNEEVAAQAAAGSFFYLVGGDPGHTSSTLRETAVWRAIVAAWEGGAALAGSSAGAMAMGEWTLIRDRFKGDSRRLYRPALGLLPRVAVLPHFETFGHRWAPSALERAPTEDTILLGIDERSAATWDGQAWRARGPGSVTVIRGDQREVSPSGTPVALPRPGTAA